MRSVLLLLFSLVAMQGCTRWHSPQWWQMDWLPTVAQEDAQVEVVRVDYSPAEWVYLSYVDGQLFRLRVRGENRAEVYDREGNHLWSDRRNDEGTWIRTEADGGATYELTLAAAHESPVVGLRHWRPSRGSRRQSRDSSGFILALLETAADIYSSAN